MIGIQVEIVGGQALQAAFVKAKDEVSDLTPVFEDIGPEALKDTQQRFDVGGPGWEPHAASTRRKKMGPLRILWDKGDLRGSFEKSADNNVFRISPLEAEFGTKDFKAVFHQEGRGHNPVRLIVYATDEQQGKYGRIAGNKVAERFRAIGFQVS